MWTRQYLGWQEEGRVLRITRMKRCQERLYLICNKKIELTYRHYFHLTQNGKRSLFVIVLKIRYIFIHIIA